MNLCQYDPLTETISFLEKHGFTDIRCGVVLGTGFGECAQAFDQKIVIPYSEIPHFPQTSADGHHGNLILGRFGGNSVVLMQGRGHFYEGYSFKQLAFPVTVLKNIGIDLLIFTNAAGGLNPSFAVGDLMIVEKHISPIGKQFANDIGDYQNSINSYEVCLKKSLLEISRQRGLLVRQGSLAWMPGPSFETRSEIAFLTTLGADAVTMSTIPEVLAAAHLGIRVAALSCISNVWEDHFANIVDVGNVVSTVESVLDESCTLLTNLISTQK